MYATNAAVTTADGSRTLYSARYRQGFHSVYGAISAPMNTSGGVIKGSTIVRSTRNSPMRDESP